MNGTVRETSDLRRILALPRRDPITEASDALVDAMTDALKTPTGTQRLRRAQALALLEIGTQGGAFCPLGVGEGKTLVTLLAPTVLDVKRTLLLLPANLIGKTERDRADYAAHWNIPTSIRMTSYEVLGRVQRATELETFRPDLIVGDEIHRLKNLDASVSRRVARHMERHPHTRFVGLSGTIMEHSLKDFGHILAWCLRNGAPIPLDANELDTWACALDRDVDETKRLTVGVLSQLTTPADEQREGQLTAVRRGYQDRLIQSPGVVATVGEGERVNASIYIKAIEYDVSDTTEGHVDTLRNEMVTPDGWEVTPVDVWRHAKELALGFHGVWDPRPPEEWRDARRAWFGYVNEVLARSKTWDSPEHVAMAIDDGKLIGGGLVLSEWRRIGPTFIPNPVPVWHDVAALNVAAKWMKQPGLVWVDHVAFGARLAEFTGAAYYSNDGLNAEGGFIDDAPTTHAVIVSFKANKEGRNLQKWSRNLVTSPWEAAGAWEQAIGRTHRTGQKADTVTVDVLLGCSEHSRAMARALAGAKAIQDTTGSRQKLLFADMDWPNTTQRSGPMWAGKQE